MRKLSCVSVVAIVVLSSVFVVFSTSGWSAEKKYVIKFASEYAEKHPTVVNGFKPWIERVKEKSGGRLVINFFNPNTLTPAREHFAATVSGAVDMAFSPQAFTPGKFPLAGVIGLPLIFDSATAGSLTTMELYKRYPEWRAEYKDVKFLWTHISALFQIHTTKKPVRTIEDLEGMKIIVWFPLARKIAKALGANPVDLTPHDTYLALERGMADGVLCPLAPLRSFKISDSTKHHTIIDLFANPFWAAMNIKKWNSLPPDLQKLLDETTGVNMARIAGQTLDSGAAKDTKWLKANGHTFYSLSPAEKQKWADKVQGLHDEWVNGMEKKGYNTAREIRETTIRLGKEFSK